MLDFQRYQLAFTAHIRNPKTNKKPAKIIDARMAVYREIVFNNLFGTVSACFPVCQQVLGKRAWQKLVLQFFSQHQSNTPIFREIPQQFLQYLNTLNDLPIYLSQLAHYEWVELAVASQVTEAPNCTKQTDLLNESPLLSPVHRLLEYDFAVHQISAKCKPTTTEKTYLLVYRNAENLVKFMVLNAMTFMLLQTIEKSNLTGKQALAKLTEQLNNNGVKVDSDIILTFGAEILQDLANQQAIIGSIKVNLI